MGLEAFRKKINPFRANKIRYGRRIWQKKTNIFFCVFEVSKSDYNIDFNVILDTKKFQTIINETRHIEFTSLYQMLRVVFSCKMQRFSAVSPFLFFFLFICGFSLNIFFQCLLCFVFFFSVFVLINFSTFLYFHSSIILVLNKGTESGQI